MEWELNSVTHSASNSLSGTNLPQLQITWILFHRLSQVTHSSRNEQCIVYREGEEREEGRGKREERGEGKEGGYHFGCLSLSLSSDHLFLLLLQSLLHIKLSPLSLLLSCSVWCGWCVWCAWCG